MLSPLHVTLAEMFRHRPGLAAELLADVLGVRLPAHGRARLSAPEAVTPGPTELVTDAVVLLEDDTRTVAAVIVEIQLRAEEDKRWTWPSYVASVRRRLRCPTILLVICPDTRTARWAAAPIDFGDGVSCLQPSVVGPSLVPVIEDPVVAARVPELAVLSVLAHADEGPFAGVEALVEALGTIEGDVAVEYALLVLAALSGQARKRMEVLMSAETYAYQSDFTRRLREEGRLEGRQEGRVASLLRILARRGIEVPEDVRAEIAECSDLDRLETWTDRALDATSIDDVLGR